MAFSVRTLKGVPRRKKNGDRMYLSVCKTCGVLKQKDRVYKKSIRQGTEYAKTRVKISKKFLVRGSVSTGARGDNIMGQA